MNTFIKWDDQLKTIIDVISCFLKATPEDYEELTHYVNKYNQITHKLKFMKSDEIFCKELSNIRTHYAKCIINIVCKCVNRN